MPIFPARKAPALAPLMVMVPDDETSLHALVQVGHASPGQLMETIDLIRLAARRGQQLC